MGRQPVEIEREIGEQRKQVGEKLARLRNRLQPDIQEVRSVTKRRISWARKRALRSFVFTAGAVGLSVVLGMGYSAWRRSARRNSERAGVVEADLQRE